MFDDTKAFSSFSVDNLQKAKEFYSKTLGLNVEEEDGALWLYLGKTRVLIYPKENHNPASHTILNFPVPNLEQAMDKLKQAGIRFEHYDLPGLKTDEKGILQGDGPRIAWFKDLAGNTLSVLEE